MKFIKQNWQWILFFIFIAFLVIEFKWWSISLIIFILMLGNS